MNCVLTNEATEVIEQLRNANWFSKFGQPLGIHEGKYALADNIHTALELMSKRVWNGILVETANRIREELFPKFTSLRDSTKHPNYNDYVDHIKAVTSSMVRDKVMNADLPDKLLATMDRVILFIVFCFQFKNYIHEPFYFEMHELIINGRIPCGWIGKDYDHGQLVIL
ncbi:MAG: hypothetical protein JNJ77_08790 [Planctomycetia bacterium]|nr:hypothetical protein [Planctomycetia bacterium]